MDSTEAAQAPTAPVALFKKRTAKGKSNLRKRAATPPPASDSDSDYSSEDESGRKIKRRKNNVGTVTASSASNATSNADLTSTKYTAERSTTIKSSNDATKQSNWYDENATDALSTKNLLGSTRAAPSTSEPPDGTYKGLANATSFIQKNPNAPTRVVGPIKAPTNLRTITVTDYSPDVCKDYKQTGFCGFGDSCKFLHAREDYKQGWQLDREWENVTKGKKVTGGTKMASANRNAEEEDSGDDDALLEGIPFACIICRDKYKDPIVTKCGHYFCESCALKRYRKDPSCAACGAGTGGVFNVAKGLKKLLDRKREKAAKRRQKAIEAGEEPSEDDDVEAE
ncbi:related to N.crassa uvs2 protein [Phialocephala subalpina]|uniref:Pre-mRNA-splicing factor CWC24 n=1 Tax=Phialocephala subalpina TaxID=576137 RepID=A0A1L7XFL9_9HELO|nr:related to N.crassa uvs2 protein [Phialocephala subalpina]